MLLNALLPAALMAGFNNLLFGLGEVFHSNVWWSRAFAMRDKVGKKAYILAGFSWLPIPVAAGFIALASTPLDINVTSPDMVRSEEDTTELQTIMRSGDAGVGWEKKTMRIEKHITIASTAEQANNMLV